MIDKEKLTKLCESYACNILHGDSIIENWLEQNHLNSCEVKVIGLSDEQLESLHTARYKEYLSLTDFINNYRQWAKSKTFSQSEVTRLEKEIAEMQIAYIDLQRYSSEIRKELEQLKSQQLKPSWSDAPDWAEWLAQDANGIWYWYEKEPQAYLDGAWAMNKDNTGKQETASNAKNWQQTLEQRPNKIHKAIAWGLGNKVVSGVEYPKVKPFVVDWEHAPSDAVEYAVIEYYKAKEGHNCHVKTLHYEQRPQPPAPKVEVGQVWQALGIEFEITQVVVGGRDYEVMCVSKIGVTKVNKFISAFSYQGTLSDFLAKFERVGGSE